MADTLSGALVMACAIAGLCFLRFWKSRRDPLFLWFAFSFWLQGLQWLLARVVALPDEYSPWQYLLRLLAYGLIAFGILRRNAGKAREPRT